MIQLNGFLSAKRTRDLCSDANSHHVFLHTTIPAALREKNNIEQIKDIYSISHLLYLTNNIFTYADTILSKQENIHFREGNLSYFMKESMLYHNVINYLYHVQTYEYRYNY